MPNPMPEVLTISAHIETELINARNQLVRLELDERFLQRQHLKPVLAGQADVDLKLGEVQKKVKIQKEIIAFLEDMRKEYAAKADQKTVS